MNNKELFNTFRSGSVMCTNNSNYSELEVGSLYTYITNKNNTITLLTCTEHIVNGKYVDDANIITTKMREANRDYPYSIFKLLSSSIYKDGTLTMYTDTWDSNDSDKDMYPFVTKLNETFPERTAYTGTYRGINYRIDEVSEIEGAHWCNDSTYIGIIDNESVTCRRKSVSNALNDIKKHIEDVL